jgi:ribosome-associated toxin RatA of RatAB toxin-antitoxin module
MSASTSTQITRSALVPFSGAQMYRLVADVPTYPQFLPWCKEADVRHEGSHSALASLTIAKGPLRKRFTTHNHLFPDHRIEMALVDGPFRHLNGCWSFVDLGGEGTRVTLTMDFEIAGGLLRRALQPIFAEIANTMVESCCRRARDLYER